MGEIINMKESLQSEPCNEYSSQSQPWPPASLFLASARGSPLGDVDRKKHVEKILVGLPAA